MAREQAPPGVVLSRDMADTLTREQLHGSRCYRGLDCTGPLVPAGHAYTTPAEDGAPLGWVVAACKRHGRRRTA
ncbi:hypothetical protein KNE206_18660 [Kitasatospora sp. NE20-6]